MPFEVHLSLHKLHVVQCSLMLLLSTLLLGEKMGESGSLCTEAFVCVCCGVAKQRSSPSFVELRLRFPVLVVARTVVVFHCCVVLRNCAKFLWISWNIGLFFLALHFFFPLKQEGGELRKETLCGVLYFDFFFVSLLRNEYEKPLRGGLKTRRQKKVASIKPG